MNYTPALAAEVRAELGRQQVGVGSLASHLGIHRTKLYRRLHGIRPFDSDELARIGALLGVPASELIRRAEQVVAETEGPAA